MKFKRIITIAISFTFFIFSGCSIINKISGGAADKNQNKKPIQNIKPDENKDSSIDNNTSKTQSIEDGSNNITGSFEEQISNMSLSEKVGYNNEVNSVDVKEINKNIDTLLKNNFK